MERDIPEWQPFETAGAVEAEILSLDEGSGPRFVAILTTAGAREDGWAVRTTVALARAWARRHGRVLLADLDLREPSLHLEVDVENGEGMSDAFLYGASIQRIAIALEPGFLFAPAGTVVADPADVLTASRWHPVLDGFSRAGATLVVQLPAESEGVDALLARTTDVVLLARPGEESGVAFGPWGDRVRAVLGPAAPVAGAGAGSGREGASLDAATPVEAGVAGPAPVKAEDEPLEDAPSGSAAGPGGAALAPHDFDHAASPRGDSTAEPGHAPGGGATPPTREKASRAPHAGGGRRTGLLLLLLLLVVVGVVVAGWLGMIEVPGVPTRESGAPAPEPATSQAAASPPSPAPVMAYSLALGAYQDAAVAELQSEGLGERRPDLLFTVAPVEVDGEVFHRLLAGPAEDSAGAVALRGDLATTLTREDPESWLVRPTPLAFRFGSFGSRQEAEARAAELDGLGLASYVLQVDPGSEGGPAFHLYGGAFADEAEAGHMRALLAEQDLGETPLERRIGRIPGPTE